MSQNQNNSFTLNNNIILIDIKELPLYGVFTSENLKKDLNLAKTKELSAKKIQIQKNIKEEEEDDNLV